MKSYDESFGEFYRLTARFDGLFSVISTHILDVYSRF